MEIVDGPDFICVGMPKAGTGWLYDQLAAHPDFWMPPVKELVYLNQQYPALRFGLDGHKAGAGGVEDAPTRRQRISDERLVNRASLDARDMEFLNLARSGLGKPRDLDFYAALFRFKGNLRSGDITPQYCRIEAATAGAIAQRFPALKILLLLRDPVARAWSRICMSYRRFDKSLLHNAAAFRVHLEGTRKLGGLFATSTYLTWREHAPELPFRFFFFDDLAANPQPLRRDVLLFLGADPENNSGDLPPDYNRKAKSSRAKPEMTPIVRDALVEHFRDELKASAELFGGPAREWPRQYGL